MSNFISLQNSNVLWCNLWKMSLKKWIGQGEKQSNCWTFSNHQAQADVYLPVPFRLNWSLMLLWYSSFFLGFKVFDQSPFLDHNSHSLLTVLTLLWEVTCIRKIWRKNLETQVVLNNYHNQNQFIHGHGHGHKIMYFSVSKRSLSPPLTTTMIQVTSTVEFHACHTHKLLDFYIDVSGQTFTR